MFLTTQLWRRLQQIQSLATWISCRSLCMHFRWIDYVSTQKKSVTTRRKSKLQVISNIWRPFYVSCSHLGGTWRKKDHFKPMSNCLILMTHNKPFIHRNKLNSWNQTLTWMILILFVYELKSRGGASKQSQQVSRRKKERKKVHFEFVRMWVEWKCEKRTFYFLPSINAGWRRVYVPW